LASGQSDAKSASTINLLAHSWAATDKSPRTIQMAAWSSSSIVISDDLVHIDAVGATFASYAVTRKYFGIALSFLQPRVASRELFDRPLLRLMAEQMPSRL
jgi:hypothetical protein